MHKHFPTFTLLLCAYSLLAFAQDAPSSPPQVSLRSSLAVIDDATVYGGQLVPSPQAQNQALIEPSFMLRYRQRWSLASSLVETISTYGDTHAQLHVRESYLGLSAGDFDFTLGRRLVRWGTGYAFTPAGVLDPPRTPTNPTDRLSINQGRDMLKVDFMRGPHALQVAWSSAALAPKGSNAHDTTTLRYNVLMRGFDTSFIAGNDQGGDAFGALTFTRVLGQAWEVHGEGAWREQGAVLLGGKYTLASGVSFIGEFYAPPNTAFYRSSSIASTAGRQHYAFFSVGKSRLRELPEWKYWDLTGYAVANLNDHSATAIGEVTRRFGNHFSGYVHLEVPAGDKHSEYGATPYKTASSMGIRFHL